MKRVVLIPAYNPLEVLIDIVNDLKDKTDVIVIDDGSDNKEIFNKIKKSCILLTHHYNCGKGNAIKTGLKYIKENYKDALIVTVDADGQHKVDDVIKIFESLEKNKDSFILGKRSLDKKIPIRSKIGNSITRRVFYKKTHVKIYDTQTGLRGFSYKMIDKLLNINGSRYEYEMNVLLVLTSDKVNIIEVPIDTIYYNNNSSSHFDTIKDSYRIYKDIIKFKA